jgi:3-phytase
VIDYSIRLQVKQAIPLILLSIALFSCNDKKQLNTNQTDADTTASVVKPLYMTDTVAHDTDDPAIWINP